MHDTAEQTTYDFIVIGAGIAGASVAYELVEQNRVLLIEAEAQPGYHSSGRSAALFTRNYGNPLVRRINALSEVFYRNPPSGFADTPLLKPRGALAVAAPGDEDKLDEVLAMSTDADPVSDLAIAEALSMVPFLRLERVSRAVFESGVTDIEAAALLQAYLKGFKKRGGQLLTGERVIALHRKDAGWLVSTPKGSYKTKTLINAAGAWADEIGAMAGALTIGLVPKRRTAIIVEALPGYDASTLPCVDFAGTDAYIKPDSGKLMASPGDATPTTPQDVQPEEMDVAVLVDWIQGETLLPVHKISHSWAGLRSFVADDSPVVGFDPVARDFFWHAAHGGYGIMMAPALARAAASLCMTKSVPADFTSAGITPIDLGPLRLR